MNTETRTARRPARTVAQWGEIVNNWQSSGKPASAYAKEHDLSYSSLVKWAARLRAVGTQTSVVQGRQSRTGERAQLSFVPVRVSRSPQSRDDDSDTRIEIVLANGRSVRVYGHHIRQETLAAVLRAADGDVQC